MKSHSVINRIAAGALAVIVAIGVYLNVPPPRHAAAFEATSSWAGTAGGTANALVLNISNIQSVGDILGVPIRFNPSANNTGPVTIAAGGLGVISVFRPSSIGLVQFSLNEFLSGETTSVVFNGSVFVLNSNVDMRPIGSTCEFRGTGAPRGCIIEDGSCVSTTQFAALSSVLGTAYGTCSGANFKLPLSNGTGFVAFDNQGAAGPQNRITTASCAAPNSPVLCGTETKTLQTANLPAYTPAGSISATFAGSGITLAPPNVGSSGANVAGTTNGPTSGTYTPGGTVSGSFSGTAQGGLSTPLPVLPPTLPGIRAIKY